MGPQLKNRNSNMPWNLPKIYTTNVFGQWQPMGKISGLGTKLWIRCAVVRDTEMIHFSIHNAKRSVSIVPVRTHAPAEGESHRSREKIARHRMEYCAESCKPPS